MTTAALSLTGVSKFYGSNSPVLTNVNLEIQPGQLACLLGPSGSGKTTLLRAVAGFESAEGEILFDGVPINGPSHDRVVVFQDANAALFPWLSVRENVEYALRRRKRSERASAVDELLELVGLQNYGAMRLHEISGGMRQRTQLARAFAAKPRMLLMDEPFGALDALTRIEMQREVARIVRGTGITVLFITHDVQEAATLGDKVFILSKGPGAHIVQTRDNPVPSPRELGDGRVSAFAQEILDYIMDSAGTPA